MQITVYRSDMLIYSTVKVPSKARVSHREVGGLMVCSKKGFETIKCSQDFSLEMNEKVHLFQVTEFLI